MQIRRASVHVAASLAIVAGLLAPVAVHGASASVECGQLTGFTAPDPSGPTDGSVQLGLLPPFAIAASATLSPAAATVLPTSVGNGPTCLAVVRGVGDKITALDFAADGTITGHVTVDTGSGFYLFADRLFIPSFITDTYPALAALFVTSEQAGTALTVTFSVNTTSGTFSAFDGAAAFCGPGGLTSAGDGKVGPAIIPKVVLDTADRAALASADGRHTCASVHAVGTIGAAGTIDSHSDVRITVTPKPTPKPTPRATALPLPATDTDRRPESVGQAGGTWAFLLASLVSVVAVVAVLAVVEHRRVEL